MSIRSILYAFLFFAPAASIASEGMIYGVVYECDAEEINRDMVEICSSGFPELSRQADDALAKWRKRNVAKANAAKEACSRELKEESTTGAANGTPAVRKLIGEMKTAMRAGFRAQILEQGRAACVNALSQLKTAGGPLDIR